MRRKHLVPLSMLGVGLALLVAAASVEAAASATSSALRGGTLRLDQSAGTFDTLDPQLAYVYNDWEVLNATQLLLLNHPDRAGEAGERLVPEAATSFPTISRHGTLYTFHLRPGLRFSDGSPVTAAAFQRAFERILSPRMFAQYGVFDGVDKDVVGGRAFAGTGRTRGKTTAKHISGIRATGLTLTIHLTHPVPSFESLLAMEWFAATKPSLPYKATKSGVLTYPSAGPYYIATHTTNLVVLKRNRYYRGSRPANPDEIVIHNLTDPETSVRKTEQNKVDLDLGGVPLADVNAVAQKYGPPSNHSQFRVDESSCFSWVALNNTRPPTDDAAVRKALNYALGRTAITTLSGRFAGTPSDQVLQPGVPGYEKLRVYGNSPNVAKAEQVGGSALQNAPPVVIDYNGLSQTRTQQAELIQSEVQAIGLKATLSPDTTGDYYGTLQGNDWNLAIPFGWCADFPDPAQYFAVPLGSSNVLHFSNSSITKAAAHAASLSGSARARAYASLDKRLMTTYAPMVPLYVDNAEYLTSQRVRNYIFSQNLDGPILNALAVR